MKEPKKAEFCVGHSRSWWQSCLCVPFDSVYREKKTTNATGVHHEHTLTEVVSPPYPLAHARVFNIPKPSINCTFDLDGNPPTRLYHVWYKTPNPL